MNNNPLTIDMVGNAHLDPAWMWQWGEGMEAFLATCRSALDRMEETADFIFTCSSAAHYRWVEEVEPDLFDRIEAMVAAGRWIVVGGWWVQADCNLPSGEGFARQALLGQRWFIEKLGVAASVGYSPDAFGHDIGLPQLLARAGMHGYIFCRPDPTELTLPSPLVRWISPDGSSVLAYRVPYHYNMYETTVAKKVADLAAAFSAPTELSSSPLSSHGSRWSLFYGVGNHGGGPTREHIAEIERIDAESDTPRLLFSDPNAFFRSVLDDPERLASVPDWKDELQLNAPGCYSAHSEIKLLNRRSEHELMRAEKISSLASMLLGTTYPAAELRRGWENVCFNHFHDLICGVAIREALDDAIAMYGESLTIARRATRHGVQRLARAIDTRGDGQTLIVFNPHSWDVTEPVVFELWHDIDKKLWGQPVDIAVVDDRGEELRCQTLFTSGKIGRDRIAVRFAATVPAFGWRSYRVHYGRRSRFVEERMKVEEIVSNGDERIAIDNGIVRLEVSTSTGAIARLLHHESGFEAIADEGARPIAIDDPTDTWGHGVTSFDRVIGEFGHSEVRMVENGPMHATIRSVSRWRECRVQQDFRLGRDADAIDVDVKLFWGAQHTMLKLSFVTPFDSARMISESAYCSIERDPDGTERPAGRWKGLIGNVSGNARGLAIVDDAKHAFSASAGSRGAELCLTVLRSPSYATHDPHPHHPDEDLDYLDQGIGRFCYRLVPIVGNVAREELARRSSLLNAPLIPHLESAHEGKGLERTYRGIDISSGRIEATVVKEGEDGSGWIVRLHETSGEGAEAEVRLAAIGGRWLVRMVPHEVQSWRVLNGAAACVDLVERELARGPGV